MVINQLHLGGKGIEPNKNFLVRLYNNSDFQEVRSWFDYLECTESFARQPDPGMTLDKFIREMTDEAEFILQIASPNPFEIRYGASYYDLENKRKHFFLECPHSDYNEGVINKLYFDSFHTKLEDEPVPDGILEYYMQRIRLGY